MRVEPAFAMRLTLKVGCIAVLIAGFSSTLFSQAVGFPAVSQKLPEVWKQKYPARADKFIPDPFKRGILSGTLNGAAVYYYNYKAIVPIPKREGMELSYSGGKEIEIWVQYLPGAKRYDILFDRVDRLPGQGWRWIK